MFSAMFDIFVVLCSHFFVTMNISDPAKPYFLDIDTGSTLTWLQCDYPCINCNKAHSLFYPRLIGSFVQKNKGTLTCHILAL